MSTAAHFAPAIENVKSSRWSQVVAWAVTSLFILGFFFSPVGAWTGPILGCWFVLTQKPLRGFVWMMAIGLIPSVLMSWRAFPLSNPLQALTFAGGLVLASLLGVLPFSIHRLTSPRLPGFLSSLPLPLAGVAISSLAVMLHAGSSVGMGGRSFLILWFAATLVWMWNHEYRGTSLFFVVGFALAACLDFSRYFNVAELHSRRFFDPTFGWVCVGGVVALSIWALLNPNKQKAWVERLEAVARLQSPVTGESLHVVEDKGRGALVSASGERFPIRDGIPSFLKADDLTGDNGKYNHLYETIGGFYDDTQRVASGIRGLALEPYFLSYMGMLEVKPGDSVLETSVGTGLNFKYLPRGVKLSGLDLSASMLANCQANMRLWEMEADLYLGNAESLPFADSSFDVVFHAGGINFFSDRAKAIREMIRVAKPGSLLLITDETEEYAKQVYEKMPIASAYYRNRKEAVSTPIDLVPAEMEEIHLEMIKGGLFYAITFRKPLTA